MNDDSSLTSSMGQSSAAVAMANDALDNARRAAASSRMKRAKSPSPPASPSSYYFVNNPNLVQSTAKHIDNNSDIIGSGRDLDLKHNDSAFHAIATLLTQRLLPKIENARTHYTITTEDAALFQKMLPSSVRQDFVIALRYRLQLTKMGFGSQACELVTMQCQKLGLERDNLNVLLDLNLPLAARAGKSYPINQSNHDETRNDDDTSFAHRGGFHPMDHNSIISDSKNYVDIMTSKSQNRERDEIPVCEVVAPSDLPGGYRFEAQLGAEKFLATVPPGGVARGQQFVSAMRELENIQISVPLGSWRDNATECFNGGIFHPLFCNTLFFPCVALGQIMARTGLDWRGEPANRYVSGLSCANMTGLLSIWLAINASGLAMLRVAWQRGFLIGAEYYSPLILFNVLLWMYMVSLTAKVRASIRNKYQIPDESCTGSEDCLCATFCMPCAICQMGRHTADYETYTATCCTSTGLPRQVKLAPVTFYDDQYQNMHDESQGHVV